MMRCYMAKYGQIVLYSDQGTYTLSTLRMPAPVYFSIVGDVPLLRILRGQA